MSVYTKKNTRDEWDIPRLYHEKGLFYYFIPCHRKYSGQMGRLGEILNKLTSVFLSVCPVIDHEFRHHILKVAADPGGDSRVPGAL